MVSWGQEVCIKHKELAIAGNAAACGTTACTGTATARKDERKMKKFKKIIAAILIVSVSMTGTMALTTDTAAAKSTPKLSKKSVLIAKGGRQTIKLKSGSGKWKIQNPKVAKIKKKSKKSVTIVPVKAGKTVLTCKSGGKTLKCQVKVLNNKVGKVKQEINPEGTRPMCVGETASYTAGLPAGISLKDWKANSKLAKVTVKTKPDPDTGGTLLTIKLKARKPGREKVRLTFLENGDTASQTLAITIIGGFRGKTKAAKTEKNYKKWRKKTITTMAKSDMSTWEIIDAIGHLISTGSYGSKGGTNGMQLWYGGNGTCVSGAKMMNDFMKDLGIKSKVRFMGDKANKKDIYGYTIMYMSQHKNTWIKLGGKQYELNPQPGKQWPIGIIAR